MNYNITTLKENLTNDDIYNILIDLDANPTDCGDRFECETICHGGDSHKLFYYFDSQIFYCYSGCGVIGDVLNLIQKVKGWGFKKCKDYCYSFINHDITPADFYPTVSIKQPDDIYIPDIESPFVESYESPLNRYPQPMIQGWINEGISHDMCVNANIRYNPVEGSILIPHYDIHNRLIGIKSRCLSKQDESKGKYQMFRTGDKTYFFSTAMNLYNINNAKEMIQNTGNAIVFEGEKSVLKLQSLTNRKNVAAVACSGSHISKFQIKQLFDCDVKRIFIAFDKDYSDESEPEFRELLKKYQSIIKKYCGENSLNDIEFRFFVDRENRLSKHDSPIDKGLENFQYLMKNSLTATQINKLIG